MSKCRRRDRMVEIGTIRDRVAAILAAPDSSLIFPHIAGYHVWAGGCANNRAAYLELWQRDSQRPAEHRCPRTGSTKYDGCFNRAVLGHHTRDVTEFFFEATDGTSRQNCCAITHGRTSNCRRRLMWFRTTVACSEQRALPGDSGATGELRDLFAGQDAGVDTKFFCDAHPRRIVLELLVIPGRINTTRLPVADIFADLCRQSTPDIQTLEDHWHLAYVPALLPHPAPVATRLLPRDMTFLAQHDIDALPGQEPCRRNADDTAANDHDVGIRRD